jgi:hypothetical protein
LHFIPTGSSWLTLAEWWFAELTYEEAAAGPYLEADIRAWLATWNANPRPYVSVTTADRILASLRTYCQRINGSEH